MVLSESHFEHFPSRSYEDVVASLQAVVLRSDVNKTGELPGGTQNVKQSRYRAGVAQRVPGI